MLTAKKCRGNLGGFSGTGYFSVTKVYGPTLGAFQGGGGVKFPENSVT